MRIVVFGEERRVGLWQDDRIIDVNRAVGEYLRTRSGNPDASGQADARAPANLRAFIEAGDEALDLTRAAAERLAGSDMDGVVFPYAGTRIWAPWPERRIACAGGNAAKHLVGIARNFRGLDTTIEEATRKSRAADPMGFWKVPLEVFGPDDEIAYPARSTRFDYEAEPTIVIGRRGKDIAAAEARSHIWGITLANDWSDRDQLKAPTTISFNLMKNFDSCLSLGPCIQVGEFDPDDIEVSLSVNGEQRQHFRSSEMIYSFAEYLEFLSRDFTFVPGDLLLGGTGEGTALDMSKADTTGKLLPELFLKPGDVVEASSPMIGALRNRIVPSR